MPAFRALLVPALLLALAGCDRFATSASAKAASAASAAAADASPLLLAPEDQFVLRAQPLAAGPLLTGSIQPERRADLRAEVAATVMGVLKDNGQPVRRGDLLVRLDDTAIRDALLSAQDAERAAGQAAEQAERQFQRLATLRASGMATAQQLEDAEIRRNTTRSELSAAKARVVQARQQLQRTEARAPFDGIVAERKVSAGDTAQVGKELLKVIDPRSLRFEGTVSADAIANVRAGQAVSLRVNGFPQEFTGRVRLVAPTANPATRQIELVADLDTPPPERVAGLYAEGRLEAGMGTALQLPASAIQREGERAFAWRVADGRIRKVAITLGPRDPRRGDWVVAAGLGEGDRLLLHPVGLLRDGQPAREAPAAAAAAPAASGGR